jgi:threonine dehydrogenase-like Zn-dependent dehydrogenase
VNSASVAVLTAPRTATLQHMAAADPGPGEVLVSIGGCGVCGSNSAVWEGRPWFEYPLAPGAPGHEAWGRIESLGDDVAGLASGQAVALLSEQAFAEVATVPASKVVPLPDALVGKMFPGEALGCGFNVARRAAFARGQTVAVIGVGFLGAVVVHCAVAAGADVIAISRRESSLRLARHLGARVTVPLDDHERIIAKIGAETGGRWCDTVVEAVGLQWPLDLAAQLTRVRGRLVVAGYHQDGPRQVDMQLWNWRGIDVINAHERDPAIVAAGVAEAAEAVALGEFDPEPLYTHEYRLDQLDAAMDAMLQRPDGFVKAMVVNR